MGCPSSGWNALHLIRSSTTPSTAAKPPSTGKRTPLISAIIIMASSSNNITPARAFLVNSANAPFEAGVVPRRALLPEDVSISIHYCGVCHSDLHMAKNHWGVSVYPMVPGHEIVGIVDAVGSSVSKYTVGQRVGVGCIVDTCNKCDLCKNDAESYCPEFTMTYGGLDRVGLGENAASHQSEKSQEHGYTPNSFGPTTHGGYSERIVVNERYVLSIPDNLDLASAAPLLCAGTTVYTPLANCKIGPGKRVGVLGIGGLGHVAIKIAAAIGAEVVALTRNASKKDEVLRLGASSYVNIEDADALAAASNTLDLIIDTVSADHNIIPLLGLLRYQGTYHLCGITITPLQVPAFALLSKQIKLTGSMNGSTRQTQEMIDLCAKHDITAQIELLPLSKVDEAFERLEKGDVRYRFVLDIKADFGN